MPSSSSLVFVLNQVITNTNECTSNKRTFVRAYNEVFFQFFFAHNTIFETFYYYIIYYEQTY